MIYFDRIYLDEVQNKPNYRQLITQSSGIMLAPPNNVVINDVIRPKVSSISGSGDTLRRYHTEDIFSS